jgi:Leucine-rich repeat (LRR) protein
MVCMRLDEFPAAVAASLTRLTWLHLGGNSFDHLPVSLSRITTLQFLNLYGNPGLQLDMGNLNTLAALPDLQRLDLCKRSGRPVEDDFLGESLFAWTPSGHLLLGCSWRMFCSLRIGKA